MAVYIMKTDPWYTGILQSAAQEGVKGLLQGMFQRSQQAAERNQFNKEFERMQNAMSPSQNYTMTVQGGSPQTSSLSSVFYEGMGVPQNNGLQVRGSGYAAPSGALGGLSSRLPGIAAGNAGNSVSFRTGSNTPTRADAYKALGMNMSAKNIDAAMKILDAQYGNDFKLQDADQVYGRVGEAPQYNDRQELLNYMNRFTAYNPTQAATMGNLIRTLNPQQNYSVINLGDQQQVLTQDPWSGEVKRGLAARIGVSPDSLEATKRSYINKDTEALRGRSGWETGNLTSAQYKAIDDARSMVARMSPEDLASLRNNPDQWANVAAMFGLPVEQMGQIIQSPFGYNTSYTNVNNDDTFGSLAPVYKSQGEVINRQGAQTLTPEETYAPSAGDIDELNKMSQEDQKKYMFLMQKTGKSLDEVREAEKNYKQQQKLKQLQQNLHSGT